MNVDNELMEFLKGLKLPSLGDIYLQGARWYKIIDYFPNYDNKNAMAAKGSKCDTHAYNKLQIYITMNI